MASDTQGSDSFSWKANRATGKDFAISRSESSFNYFDVGDLSHHSLYLVQQDLGRLAAATGLSIDRSAKTSSSIAIVHDTKVFHRLKNDKPAFAVLGIPDNIIALLEQGLQDDAKCAAVSVSDGDSNMLFTVILLSEKFNECLARGLIESFGIIASDISTKVLIDACILYEARRLGLRDRQSLEQESAKLREQCSAKAESR